MIYVEGTMARCVHFKQLSPAIRCWARDCITHDYPQDQMGNFQISTLDPAEVDIEFLTCPQQSFYYSLELWQIKVALCAQFASEDAVQSTSMRYCRYDASSLKPLIWPLEWRIGSSHVLLISPKITAIVALRPSRTCGST